MKTITKVLLPILALFSAMLMAQPNDISPESIKKVGADKVFYLVRHTEKLEGDNPGLTAQGQLRAVRLAKVLSSTLLSKVYTTDYKRTRETALAVAQAQHAEPNIYDPRDLKAVATTLLNEQGHILVVGHSNTTTELVEMLGGDKQPPIDDNNEFDRLYIVTVDGNNRMVSTVLLRY
ncbi:MULTISPECIES: histidine phosphatase family protein [Shewanella]|uniref:Histidine phosphatase family protein n=1 Tax=Shewanella polaris TaxID=2588449 RepID=A0A4Y5YFY4_9GAMM|nr:MULTISPECIES: histidine phosphatase family protein [Shewanella]QDE31537.1 histidine phosphatase family protein [Shewanella polaris]